MSTETQNIAFVEDLYAAFGRGDLPYILSRFAPELESFGVVASGQSRAPFHFQGRSREDVARYFEMLLTTMEPVRFSALHVAAGGDHVYATLDHAYRVRKTGQVLDLTNSVHRFTVRDGLVVAWFAADDTQKTVEALA